MYEKVWIFLVPSKYLLFTLELCGRLQRKSKHVRDTSLLFLGILNSKKMVNFVLFSFLLKTQDKFLFFDVRPRVTVFHEGLH